MNFTRWFAIFLLLSAPLTSQCQSSDLGTWWIYFGNKKLSERWNLHHEVQYRNYNAIGDLEQLLLRAGVGYNLTPKNNNVLLGYGFILSGNYTEDGEKVNNDEHRIYQQFQNSNTYGRTSIKHRYRIEERWTDSGFKMRFRYFLALNIALNNWEMIDNTLYLSGYNELFIGNQSPLFDRNRIYGGLGFKFNKALKVELGYMNQVFDGSGRDQLNVILFANF